MAGALLNPRREKNGRNGKLTLLEQRFYSGAPRYEDAVKRACGKSIIMLRSEIAMALMRGLDDLSSDYESARQEATATGRPANELEARYGAALVLVHLQVLAKIDELEQLAAAATPVADVTRLADNLSGIARMLAAIEAGTSVAVTGDLNEDERRKISSYDEQRFVRLAEAIQLRREAQAATKRLAEGRSDGQQDLAERAKVRLDEIRAGCEKLRADSDLGSEVQLDQVLKQISILTR